MRIGEESAGRECDRIAGGRCGGTHGRLIRTPYGLSSAVSFLAPTSEDARKRADAELRARQRRGGGCAPGALRGIG